MLKNSFCPIVYFFLFLCLQGCETAKEAINSGSKAVHAVKATGKGVSESVKSVGRGIKRDVENTWDNLNEVDALMREYMW